MELKDLGNIYSSGNSFTTRAALLQSWYRVSKNETCGFATVHRRLKETDSEGNKLHETYTKEYGHIVRDGELTNKNFFFDETFEFAKDRVKNKKPDETIKADRLFNNLLSSMPLAFNLFHPLMLLLKKDPIKTTQIVAALFPSFDIQKVEKIDIEFIPLPIDQYINDKSAMDAMIIFSDKENKRSLISIECKYSDSLGSNLAKDNKLKYQTGIELNLFSRQGLWHIKDQGCTQIYRNFLLTEKYRVKHKMVGSWSVILAPQGNPTTDSEIQSIDCMLLPEYRNEKIFKYTLEDFVNTLGNKVPEDYHAWVKWLYDRYLDFSKIEQLYSELKSK